MCFASRTRLSVTRLHAASPFNNPRTRRSIAVRAAHCWTRPFKPVPRVRRASIRIIDRLKLLKDPAEGIYGMRGANGVIVIKTKRLPRSS